MIRIVWLPVNQAWLVMFGESRLAGPFNDKADAIAYCQDLMSATDIDQKEAADG